MSSALQGLKVELGIAAPPAAAWKAMGFVEGWTICAKQLKALCEAG